jgi:hypothetical protein
MTEEQVKQLLRDECRKAGSQAAWAKAHGISLAYVNEVLRIDKPPGPLLLAALGIEKSYRRVKQ